MRYVIPFLILLLVVPACDTADSSEADLLDVDGRIRSQLFVWLNIPGQAGTDWSTRIHYLDRSGSTTIEQSDFAPDAAGALQAGPYLLSDEGKLALQVHLLDANGSPVSGGAIWLDLAPHWRWDVFVAVGTTSPLYACFGCQGGQAFALDTSLGFPAGDSLYVAWAGHTFVHPEAR